MHLSENGRGDRGNFPDGTSTTPPISRGSDSTPAAPSPAIENCRPSSSFLLLFSSTHFTPLRRLFLPDPCAFPPRGRIIASTTYISWSVISSAALSCSYCANRNPTSDRPRLKYHPHTQSRGSYNSVKMVADALLYHPALAHYLRFVATTGRFS